MPKVWLAVHAWYHPASESDSYRRNIAKSLSTVGLSFGIITGKAIPSGPISESVLPVALRNFMTYGRYEGLIHDLYGDSVFRNVDIATIQDLFWNTPHVRPLDKLIQYRQLLYQGYRRTIRRSKVVIATTTFTRDELLKHFGVEFRNKVEVVPIPCLPESPGGGNHSRYDILWVGSTQKRKGPLDFVKAIGKLPRQLSIAIRIRHNSSLISEDMELIRAMVSSYKREGRRVDLLEFEMPWESMDELYRSSKCLVSTSKYEGFHMPVAEAYLRGVHVILPTTDFYRCTYGDQEGIHWYTDLGQMPSAIVEATEYGPFKIEQLIAERHSYTSVGMQLKGVYERISRR